METEGQILTKKPQNKKYQQRETVFFSVLYINQSCFHIGIRNVTSCFCFLKLQICHLNLENK